jgi:hypothetical protein
LSDPLLRSAAQVLGRVLYGTYSSARPVVGVMLVSDAGRVARQNLLTEKMLSGEEIRLLKDPLILSLHRAHLIYLL